MKFVALNRFSSQKVELVFVEDCKNISIVIVCDGVKLVGDYLISDSLIPPLEMGVDQNELVDSILSVDGFKGLDQSRVNELLYYLPELIYALLPSYDKGEVDKSVIDRYDAWVLHMKDYKSGEFEFK